MVTPIRFELFFENIFEKIQFKEVKQPLLENPYKLLTNNVIIGEKRR